MQLSRHDSRLACKVRVAEAALLLCAAGAVLRPQVSTSTSLALDYRTIAPFVLWHWMGCRMKLCRMKFHCALSRYSPVTYHTRPSPGCCCRRRRCRDCGNFVNVRNAQMAGLLLPNVSYATAVDLGDRTSPYVSVHPRRKQEVCRRLSLQALKLQYGMTELVRKNTRRFLLAMFAMFV